MRHANTTPAHATLRAFVVFAAVCVALTSAVPAQLHAQAPPADRLNVLFLGDNGHHRPYERAKTIMPVLAHNGIDMFYTDEVTDLNAERLSRYHALIFYNNQPTISREQLAALHGFVENGGGLVVLHSASASFQNSEEFIRLTGAAFKSHGTGVFSTHRVQADHPAIAGVPTFESWDETYVHTKHNPINRTVLEIRREAGHDEPWTWVRTHGDGRVFYTAWGHDGRTWGNEGFQRLLVQGIRWATGDWALQRVAAAPALRTVMLEVPLPVYERPPAPWNTLAETPIREIQDALPVSESLSLATLQPGFSIDWFATEPHIGRIVDFAWDERGRLWVVETNDYPNRVLPDTVPGGDRVLILEDTDGDGHADTLTEFADGLNLATSIVHVNGGVIIAQAPDFFFMKDTTGDDRYDVKERIMTGWPRNDTHGTTSNLRYGFDNRILGSVGYNGFRGTVGGRTWERGEFGSGYYRFTADGSSLEYLARTSNNTWGVALSEDGYIFGSTANNRPSNFVHIPARYYNALRMREPILPGIEDRADIYPVLSEIRQVDQFGRYTAGTAHEIYTARAFPEEYWNRAAFVADPTGHLIGMFDLRRNGSTFIAKNRWSFMASRDTWLAPVQVKVGPDGALWVADFYSLVAQHNPTPRNMDGCCAHGEGNAYETPNRDAYYSRIYRISYDNAAAYTPMRLDNATSQQLVSALSHDNMFWRMTAQRLLVERGALDVVAALVSLVTDQRIDALGMNAAALHALWTLDGLGVITTDIDASEAARSALHHPAASMRRAALMILPRTAQLEDDIFAAGLLPDRSAPGAMDYTVPSAVLQDADASVRLEALLALSELPPSPRAAAAIAEVLLVPQNARDRWIPDAVAIAGAVQGPAFLRDLVGRNLPSDSAALAGVARTVELMARFHATDADPAVIVALIGMVPQTHVVVGAGLLAGIAAGWPEETPPSLTPEQRSTLSAAAAAAPAELAAAFGAIAERWGLPDVFR